MVRVLVRGVGAGRADEGIAPFFNIAEKVQIQCNSSCLCRDGTAQRRPAVGILSCRGVGEIEMQRQGTCPGNPAQRVILSTAETQCQIF